MSLLGNNFHFLNPYGFINYLNEQHHYFYLDRSPYRNQMTNYYYQEAITLPDPKPIIDVLSKLPNIQIKLIIRQIKESKNDNVQRRKLMYKVPHPIRIQVVKNDYYLVI